MSFVTSIFRELTEFKHSCTTPPLEVWAIFCVKLPSIVKFHYKLNLRKVQGFCQCFQNINCYSDIGKSTIWSQVCILPQYTLDRQKVFSMQFCCEKLSGFHQSFLSKLFHNTLCIYTRLFKILLYLKSKLFAHFGSFHEGKNNKINGKN